MKGSSRTSHPVIMCMENYGPVRSRSGDADIFSRRPHPSTASPQSLATKTNAEKPAHLLRQRFAKEISRKTCVAYWALGYVHEKTMPGDTFFSSSFSPRVVFLCAIFFGLALSSLHTCRSLSCCPSFCFHCCSFSSPSVCDLWVFPPEFWPSPLSF